MTSTNEPRLGEAQVKNVTLIADWWSERLTYGDKRGAFKSALIAALTADGIHSLFEESDTRQFCTISTDYDPDELLWDALEAAGLDMRRVQLRKDALPRKTIMKLYPSGRVVVKEGYGQPFAEIVGDDDSRV